MILPRKLHPFCRLRRCRSGVALIEFAIGVPVFLTLTLTGAETANWIITKMRVSQLALHIADNASRMGDGTLLQAKTISETDINDILTGASTQSGDLKLYNTGRVILSDIEQVPDPNPNDKNYIRWQRCRGLDTHTSQYGDAAVPNSDGTIKSADQRTGVGPAGRQIDSQDNNPTMFVEVFYNYSPLVSSRLAPTMTFDEIASMTVRDRRDLSQIYNTENAAKSTCDKYTAT